MLGFYFLITDMQNQENLEEKLVSGLARKIWKGEGREKHLERISSKTAALLSPCLKLCVN